MANAGETPRQKMISLMYLVLMALLALNVSKDVINAFLVVNERVDATNKNYLLKEENIFTDFKRALNQNPAKVDSFYKKALHAKDISHELVAYLESIKLDIISLSEKITVDSAARIGIAEIEFKENYMDPTTYFIGNSEDGSAGKAYELKQRIITYKQQMLSLLDERATKKIKLGLHTEGEYYNAEHQKQNWEMHNFYYTILVADLLLLNNFISEVYNAELDVLNALYESIDAGDYQYEKISAKVLAKSNYVFIGENYEAEILVTAVDYGQNQEAVYLPEVDSLDSKLMSKAISIDCSSGKIKINIPARAPGYHKYAGVVKVKNNSGEISNYPFRDEYIVAEPSLTVSATKMNVLYVGVENPVSISVPGIPTEKLRMEISCGLLTQPDGKDEWFAQVGAECRTAIITVYYTLDGNSEPIGMKKFRVKKLPNPVATIANNNRGYIKKELLLVAGAVAAKMPDDFEYDLKFVVKEFTLSIQRGFNMYHYTSKSDKLTSEMLAQIQMLNRGQNAVFENIVAVGPDGEERQLAPIVFTVN